MGFWTMMIRWWILVGTEPHHKRGTKHTPKAKATTPTKSPQPRRFNFIHLCTYLLPLQFPKPSPYLHLTTQPAVFFSLMTLIPFLSFNGVTFITLHYSQSLSLCHSRDINIKKEQITIIEYSAKKIWAFRSFYPNINIHSTFPNEDDETQAFPSHRLSRYPSCFQRCSAPKTIRMLISLSLFLFDPLSPSIK